MPITDDDSTEAKDKDQLIGVLVLVGIIGGLLFVVLKVMKKKK